MAAVVTFGVTLTLLTERFFGAVTVGDRWTTTATEVIEEVASDVETRLRGLRVEATDITETSAPQSYRWLQTTILYGVAAEVGRRTGGAEVDAIDSWDEKYRDRIRELSSNSNLVLGDLTTRRQRTRTLHVFR